MTAIAYLFALPAILFAGTVSDMVIGIPIAIVFRMLRSYVAVPVMNLVMSLVSVHVGIRFFAFCCGLIGVDPAMLMIVIPLVAYLINGRNRLRNNNYSYPGATSVFVRLMIGVLMTMVFRTAPPEDTIEVRALHPAFKSDFWKEAGSAVGNVISFVATPFLLGWSVW